MSPLEKLFGKTAQLTVLEYLMKNKGELNYLSEIAEGTGDYTTPVWQECLSLFFKII